MTQNIKKKFKIWKGRPVEWRTKERKNYVAAPSAGAGIMRIYRELLKKATSRKKEFRVLVLGATPELRDLVLGFGGELVTIDISWEMIEKTTPLMKYQNHPREIILKANWLNNPIKDNNFDVILGDAVTLNMPHSDQNKFFKEMKRLLKPGGFIILRETVISPRRGIRKLKEIDSDFLKSKIHWFDMFIDFILYSDILSKIYTPRIGLHEAEKFLKELKRAYLERKISKKSLKLCEWYKGSGARTIWPKPKFEGLFKKYFKSIPTNQAKDFNFTQDTIIFFFGKNKK